MDTGDVRVFKHIVQYTWIHAHPRVSMVTCPHSNEQTKFAQFSFLHGKTKAEIYAKWPIFEPTFRLKWFLYNLFYQNGSFQKFFFFKSTLFDDYYYWRLRLFFTQIGDFSGYFWTSPGYIWEKIIGNTDEDLWQLLM